MFNFYTTTLEQDHFDPDGELPEEDLMTELYGPGTRTLEDYMVLQAGPLSLQDLKKEVVYWIGTDAQQMERAELELLSGYWFICFDAPRIRANGTWQVTFCKFEQAAIEEVAA